MNAFIWSTCVRYMLFSLHIFLVEIFLRAMHVRKWNDFNFTIRKIVPRIERREMMKSCVTGKKQCPLRKFDSLNEPMASAVVVCCGKHHQQQPQQRSSAASAAKQLNCWAHACASLSRQKRKKIAFSHFLIAEKEMEWNRLSERVRDHSEWKCCLCALNMRTNASSQWFGPFPVHQKMYKKKYETKSKEEKINFYFIHVTAAAVSLDFYRFGLSFRYIFISSTTTVQWQVEESRWRNNDAFGVKKNFFVFISRFANSAIVTVYMIHSNET